MSNKIKTFIAGLLCFTVLAPSASAFYIDVVEQSLFYDSVGYFTYEVPIIDQDRDFFKPLDKITKAEFFKLMLSSGGYPTTAKQGLDIPYHDVTGDEWFATFVKQSLDIGLIQVSQLDPNFHPGSTITRGEGLNLILSYYGFDPSYVQDISQQYTDIPVSSPYYDAAKIAYEFQLMHDYKTRQLLADRELTRAETVHILYKLHFNGITQGLQDLDGLTIETVDPLDETFALLYDVFEIITDEYIDKDSISDADLVYGAISGMVTKLDDPYSEFYEPIDSTVLQENLDGNVEGIGIYLSNDNGVFVVLTPLKGSPAEKAGIKPNDIVTEVDSVSATGLSLKELVDLIRGPAGTTVNLKIKRDSSIFNFNILREQLNIPYVEGEVKNGIGIINYYQFTTNSHDQFEDTLDNIIAQNPKGLIFDLRNNPGGYLHSAQLMISRFIPDNEPYVNLTLADGYTYSERSFGPGDLKDLPLVILVNEGSASASEIVALALKDQSDAIIVGMQTFGKSKIQELMSYEDGSALKLSIAKWTSPNGTFIGDVGITPDHVIEITENDIANDRDPQLLKALSLI